MYVQRGWSNNNKKTYSEISNQVNKLVDACYNIVKSKNLSIKICQEINKSVFSFSISIDVNKKRKKKSPSQKKREEKRRKDWIKKKEDANKLTTDDSEASDKCESPPIVPANTDTKMVDDIASDSDSTSTTNDSEASDKCESPLIDPGKADTQIADAECKKLFQEIMGQIRDFWDICDNIKFPK